MNLQVNELEVIEITDPLGLCNPPAQQTFPSPQFPTPVPQITTPVHPGIQPAIPRTGDTPWYRHYDNSHKWGIGGNMIEHAGGEVEAEKWEKNWQSKLGTASENFGAGAMLEPDGDGHFRKARGKDGTGYAS